MPIREPDVEQARSPAARRHWLRRWPYLVGGLVIVAVMSWAQADGRLEGLATWASETVEDLDRLTPLSLLQTWWDFLDPCHDVRDFRGNYVRTSCNYWQLIDPRVFVAAFVKTLWSLWENASGPALLLFPALMVAAVPIAARAVLALQTRLTGHPAELNLINVAGIAVAVPVVTSLTALGFKWLAIGLLQLFGAVVAMLITYSTLFATILQLLKTRDDILAHADTLESLHHRLTGSGETPRPEPTKRQD